jgi:ABC-type transporter Mla subunit MlaD
VEVLLAGTNRSLTQIEPILEELRKTATEVTGLTSSFNAQTDQIPAMTARIQSVLASVDSILVDLRETTPELPAVTRGIGEATANVPVLLGMTQQTLAELESLLRQLRNSWLLGGGGDEQIGGGRLPPREVRP